MNRGRPLRFLLLTLAGWITLRVAVLWPAADRLPALIGTPAAHAAERPLAAAPPARAEQMAASPATAPPTRTGASPARSGDQPITRALVFAAPGAGAPGVAAAPGPVLAVPPLPALPQRTPADPLLRQEPGRWAATAWLLARGGAGGTLTGGRLGASQAGVRVTYALSRSHRLSLAARIATPLAGRGREAAIGLDWQPTALPIHLVAEQRAALDGGRGGPTLGVIAGYGPGPIGGGFSLETYGQAGAIKRDRVEGFVDTATRLTRAVPIGGGLALDVGAGGWASAQRGAARVDVGPTVGVRVPVGRTAVRVAVDWRERVAGQASPGSGPALSIGSDF